MSITIISHIVAYRKQIVQSDDWITKHAYLLDVYNSSQTRGIGQFTNYFYYISNFKWSIKALYNINDNTNETSISEMGTYINI